MYELAALVGHQTTGYLTFGMQALYEVGRTELFLRNIKRKFGISSSESMRYNCCHMGGFLRCLYGVVSGQQLITVNC